MLEGRRRIVLATAIAETSLTLDGVRAWWSIPGLARLAEFDRAAGTTHLVTRRASQGSRRPQRGRARGAAGAGGGLQAVGRRRATPAARNSRRPRLFRPILPRCCCGWPNGGRPDPAALAWLDPPPEASVAAARGALQALAALDATGRITLLGKAICRVTHGARIRQRLCSMVRGLAAQRIPRDW